MSSTANAAQNIFPINLKTLTDKERHDYILKTYVLQKESRAAAGENHRHKRDVDIIVANHRFLWDDDDNAVETTNETQSWEQRLSRRYYDKLFKEYCIADLTRHQENKVALRWRTEAEVVAGIGQFLCGNRKCNANENLRTWEVNFAYMEHGKRKNALVKLRLCPEHSAQLNYTSQKREVKRKKQHQKELRRQEKRTLKESKRNKGDTSRDDDGDDNSSSGTKKRKTATVDDDTEQHEVHEQTEVNATDQQLQEPKHDDELLGSINQNEDVWSNQQAVPEEATTTAREHEFERYLEDLLL